MNLTLPTPGPLALHHLHWPGLQDPALTLPTNHPVTTTVLIIIPSIHMILNIIRLKSPSRYHFLPSRCPQLHFHCHYPAGDVCQIICVEEMCK